MNYISFVRSNISSIEMIDNNKLVISLYRPFSVGIIGDYKDEDIYKISNKVIDSYVYLPKDNKVVINFFNSIFDVPSSTEIDGVESVDDEIKTEEKPSRKMKNYNKYMKNGTIIKCVYKKDIYYGIYDVKKKLINNKYRSLSAFVCDISGGKNRNGWGKCEKLEENGRWISIDSLKN